ncbi:hypothetical protein BDZ89DRAFT_1142940 [Hymenopellis radicata]|nr:hypothetical protein BDZ89DRAFT_1142940 [Hymenopellis radicata]
MPDLSRLDPEQRIPNPPARRARRRRHHNAQVQYPFLDLRVDDTSIGTERVFSPFHPVNLFDIRTIAWLLSIEFITLDVLTEEDRSKVGEYKARPEGQLVWHPDGEYNLTAEHRRVGREVPSKGRVFPAQGDKRRGAVQETVVARHGPS